ncbi:hypothetical protein IJ596_03920 [bacterium]|nr:hypothetical protein [bacterium]
MSNKYILRDYSINVSKEGNFIIEYTYKTPAYIYYMPDDDYHKSFVLHKVIEHIDKNNEIIKTTYKMSTEKEYNEAGEQIQTNYKESDLKPILDKKRKAILDLITKNNLYNKIPYKKNGYIITYFWGLKLFFENEKNIIKIKKSNEEIKMLKYWEDNSSIELLPHYTYVSNSKTVLRYYNRTKAYKVEYPYKFNISKFLIDIYDTIRL